MAKEKIKNTKRQAQNCRHPESGSLMRPDVGTQAQLKKLPPKKYRYDYSLSPSLEWDGQNPARERGEALIREILDAKSIEEMKAVASNLKAMSKPFLNWAGKQGDFRSNCQCCRLFSRARFHESHSRYARRSPPTISDATSVRLRTQISDLTKLARI
jgi:hypothetical protein